MNIEEIKERLKENIDALEKLRQKYTVVEEESNQNHEEIENIDETIEKYELEVKELKEKLANEDNYRKEKGNLEANERKIVEDLLAESISQEREDIFKSSQLYRKQQEQQTKMLGIYNSELVTLRAEIRDIEARLNKDTIAKKNGIAKKLHLSDEEVRELQLEKSKKLELIEMSSQVMEICAEEIRRYGKLITENNSRLSTITKKEQRLAELTASKSNDDPDLDRYKMRLDKDRLAKQLSALQALKNRKEFLLYNPSEEINKEIVKNKELFESLMNKKEDIQSEEKSEVTEPSFTPEHLFDQVDAERELDNNLFTPDNSNMNVQPEVQSEPKVNEEEPERDLGEQEQTKNDNEKALVPINNQMRDLIEIQDAPETLKKQKLSDKFLKLWNKWRNKAMAVALAAAMTVTAGISLSKIKEEDFDDIVPDKSASDMADLPDYNIGNNDNLNFEVSNPNFDKNNSNDITNNNQEEISKEHQEIFSETNVSVSPVEPEVEQTVVRPVIKEETKPIVQPTESKNDNYYIPEVEVEPVIPDTKLPTLEETTPSVQFDGIINNSDIETTVLQTEGEFVEITLPNGDMAYIQYGDNAENVPAGITVKYIGTDMYIYSPIVNTKAL